uniref:Impact N-terminal domain-containing protein n=1 Tax=Magallana gigas TaxID=29159 RepID=K1Q338_MAGGI
MYRFSDSSGRVQEGYYYGGEHGAGRRLLHYMKTNQMQNIAVVITPRSGHTQLGPERFNIMEEHVCDVANLLDHL